MGSSLGPLRFASPLSVLAWTVLAGIPVGIIALYFLKLRRRPVQVSSTLLWRRSLEDLHVNSLFQRLRRNLLLFLQLLAVLLAMLALAGPKLKGSTGIGQRTIFLIDNSASMSAVDVTPNRLEKAKEEAGKLISRMASGDLAMIIAFSDRARVVSTYSSNRALLQQRLASIEPTQGTTSLREALQVASGLANPSSDLFARNLPQGVIATQAMVPPKLMIYTDGGFPDVEGFSVGNLVPEIVVIGAPPPPASAAPSSGKADAPAGDPSNNLAILALQASRNEERPDQFQVFGRAHNYRATEAKTEAKLYRRRPDQPADKGTLIDAVALEIGPRGEQSFKFDLPDTGASVALEVRIDETDDLALDNHAFTVLGNPRKAQVLLVTTGNRYLVDTLKTPSAGDLADVEVASPDELKADPNLDRNVRAGRYDLVIYDRFRPEAPPEANALYIGALPPGAAFEKTREVEYPVILDWNLAHPLLQYIRDLALVRVAKARVVDLPVGSTTLIESNQGTIGFVVPRGGYADAVITFSLIDGKAFNSDWPVHVSFPLFLFNALRVLGNAREAGGDELHRPGQPVIIRAEALTDSIAITPPTGKPQTLTPTPQGGFLYNGADQIGLYHAKWGKSGSHLFSVNIFDPRESDLATRGMVPEGTPSGKADDYKIKIGYTAVAGTRKSTPSEIAWWPFLAALMLGVLLVEWYIYNRRVYV